jgi:predicted metal-dependent phosphotriesterase family hydrolase
MGTINSVLNAIDVGAMGCTLTHEHLGTASAGIR